MSETDRQVVRPLWICVEERAESAGGRVVREVERETAEMIAEHTEIEDEDADEDADEAHRKVMHTHDPKLPSKAEVLEPQLTHLPYRTRCPHCIQRRDDDSTVSECHMDYCFPGDEMGQRLTLLVVVERHTKMKKVIVVPSKGSTGRYAATQVLDLIGECGDKPQHNYPQN